MHLDKKKFINFVTCFVFAALIILLAILSITSPIKIFSENENRMLAEKPKFSLYELFRGSYTSDYETFLIDQFVYRDSWIGIKTMSEAALQKKELNGVYIAKGGYLIEAYTSADADYEQMAKNEERFVEFAEKYSRLLGENRVHIMLVPTASSILSSKLPAYAEVFDQQEVILRVKERLPFNTFVNVYDVLKNNSEDYIYYRTDHHWTTKGAYYAYLAWAEASGFIPFEADGFKVERVSDEFRGTIYSKLNIDFVKPDDLYLYKTDLNYKVEYNNDGIISDTLYETSHLDTKDKYSVFLNGNNALVRIDTENQNGRKLLIIKDSFGHCFAPFALNHYETTYMVDLRYFNMPLSGFIEEYEITDILVLYNVKNFISESTVYKLIR